MNVLGEFFRFTHECPYLVEFLKITIFLHHDTARGKTEIFDEVFINRFFHVNCTKDNLSGSELNDLKLAITTGILILVCVAWFYGTMLVPLKRTREEEERVDRFFDDMNRPIDPEKECSGAEYNSDERQFYTIGMLALVYGISILLLLIFDNAPAGRLAILLCGGFVAGLGAWLIHCGRKTKKRKLAEQGTLPESALAMERENV